MIHAISHSKLHLFLVAIVLFIIFSSIVMAQEKVPLKRKSTSNLNPRGEETSRSVRGPIMLSLGGYGNFRITDLSHSTQRIGLSGGFAARTEAMIFVNWLAVFDLGYYQMRHRIREDRRRALPYEGNLRTDYFTAGLLGGGRYALANLKWPRFVVGVKWLRPVSAYGLLGFAFNFRTSSQWEVTHPIEETYDFAPYSNLFVLGLNIVLGFDVRISRFSAFLEFVYMHSLLENYRNTISRVLVMPSNAELGLEMRLGLKMPVVWLGGNW